MKSTLLEATRRGKNGWRRYLLGTLITILVPILITAILGTILLLIASPFYPSVQQAFSGKFDFLLTRFYGYPFLYFFLLATFFVLVVRSLTYVIENIHDRPFLSLVNWTRNTIRWQRALQGFFVSFCLFALAFSIFYALYPERYEVRFNVAEWLLALPFALLVAGFIVTVKCLFFFSYLLQGMGLVVQKRGRLTIVYGGILALLTLLIFQPPLINWLLSSFVIVFLISLVLRDEGIELAIGFLLARQFFFTAIVGNANEALQAPTIFKRVVNDSDSLLSLVVLMTQAALFYYICFYLIPKKPHRQLR